MERSVLDPGVIPVALPRGQEEVLFSRFPRGKQGLAGEALAIGQGLGEGLVARFGQQQDADDADEGAAGEDDVVEEVAFLVVELHDWGGQQPEASTCQDQAHTTAPEVKDTRYSPPKMTITS